MQWKFSLSSHKIVELDIHHSPPYICSFGSFFSSFIDSLTLWATDRESIQNGIPNKAFDYIKNEDGPV